MGILLHFWRSKTLEIFENDIGEFIKISNNKYIFIDKVQYCKNIGKNLKYIYDISVDKVKIIVTATGSFVIKALVGRYIYFELLSLDFEEFCWEKIGSYNTFLKNSKLLN